MRGLVFLINIMSVTVYLAVTAIEDGRSCEVTRWKHLIGFVPAVSSFVINVKKHSFMDMGIVLAFAILFVVIGYAGIYGVADGFVFANLSLLFGGIGGTVGIGAVILIAVIAAFSAFFCHIVKCIMQKKKIFQNAAGAFIPHILFGYVVLTLGLIAYGFFVYFVYNYD